MERSEPALAPEWLRCSGSVAGGSPSSHNFASSSLHSDFASCSAWNRCSRSSSDKDSQRPAFLERSQTSVSRRSSGSNGSPKHPYSSFNRSHRDRNREKDIDRSINGDIWDRDSNDLCSIERSSLRRSQSLVSGRTGDVLPRRTEDSRNCVNNQQYKSANGILLGGNKLSGVQKATFDKDFPSLGNEDKLGGSCIGRVSSPVLSTAVKSLPIVNSGLLGGEKWTSALAEVPSVFGSTTIGSSSAQQSAVATPSSGASSSMAGLNMAEALSQASPHARAAPQVPDKTQRLEELAIKQSRQLIPMTPSMPKALVSSSSEKAKQAKAGARVGEVIVAARNVQQQQQQQPLHHSSQVSNQNRGGQVKSDVSNASHAGKFLILKAARENGANSTTRDVSSPTHNVNANGKVASGQLTLNPLTPTALTSPNNPKASTLEKKAAVSIPNSRPTAEKKFSLSQAQSRTDFFNLMRKKTLLTTSGISDSSSIVSSPCDDKFDESTKESKSAAVSPHIAENGCQMISNSGNCGSHDARSFAHSGDKNMCLNEAVCPDEEEAEFLRSLGWEENGEDVEITDEEISAFYEEYQKFMPSLKVWRGIQPKCSMLSEFHSSNSGAASSESGSAGSESEA
ncbi:hypothetical protein ACH5RR_033901 [Cinchona calisaya]|uniref:Uncharacterized protein n=1 Tax=Cinchona calisaya TaxID=153742 RepID=A0ABD2YCX3_9GENT